MLDGQSGEGFRGNSKCTRVSRSKALENSSTGGSARACPSHDSRVPREKMVNTSTTHPPEVEAAMRVDLGDQCMWLRKSCLLFLMTTSSIEFRLTRWYGLVAEEPHASVW